MGPQNWQTETVWNIVLLTDLAEVIPVIVAGPKYQQFTGAKTIALKVDDPYGTLITNKYVNLFYCRAKMYAGRAACCPFVSHGECADGTDRQTDRR